MPDPLVNPAAFAIEVGRLVAQHRVHMLIGIAEPSLLAILPVRESFAPALIPFPDAAVFRRICDKAEVLATAHRLGIATPAHFVLKSRETSLPADLPFPLAVKPARSVSENNGRRVKVGVHYADDASDLATIVREMDAAAFPLLLQQRIVGPGMGVFLLRWNGKFLAQFGHRRIREKPPSGGVSVYRESVPIDPSMLDRSRQLLEAFDWKGVAMIEYKVDATSGTPYLMEINGRFWGSLQLAIDAGVDFPRLLVDATSGRVPRPVVDYRMGIRSRWWWGDVDQLVTRLLRSRAALALPSGTPGRVRAIREFLHLWRRGDRNEILQWGDTRPFIRESLDWIRGR